MEICHSPTKTGLTSTKTPGIGLELEGVFRQNAANAFYLTATPSCLAMPPTKPDVCDIQRRNDGAVLVRVRSTDRQGRQLPDAVFTFQRGDPQYDYWEQQLGATSPKQSL